MMKLASLAAGFRRPKALQTKRDTDGGFTLVELLVVLVILSLIMGLVAPRVLGYLSDARVRSANCRSTRSARRSISSTLMPAGTPRSPRGFRCSSSVRRACRAGTGRISSKRRCPKTPGAILTSIGSRARNRPTQSCRWARMAAMAAPTMPVISTAGDRRGSDRGFALYELILALAILGMVAALVVPQLARAPGPVEIRVAAEEIAALLRSDRNMALRLRARSRKSNVTDGLVLAGASDRASSNSARGQDRVRSVEPGVGEQGSGINFCRTAPPGGALTLSRQDFSYQIYVNWLTAACVCSGRDEPDDFSARRPEEPRGAKPASRWSRYCCCASSRSSSASSPGFVFARSIIDHSRDWMGARLVADAVLNSTDGEHVAAERTRRQADGRRGGRQSARDPRRSCAGRQNDATRRAAQVDVSRAGRSRSRRSVLWVSRARPE